MYPPVAPMGGADPGGMMYRGGAREAGGAYGGDDRGDRYHDRGHRGPPFQVGQAPPLSTLNPKP